MEAKNIGSQPKEISKTHDLMADSSLTKGSGEKQNRTEKDQ